VTSNGDAPPVEVPGAERPGRRRLVRALGFAVIAVSGLLAARHVDLRAVGRTLAGANPWLVALSCAANLLSLAFHSRRWAAVVRPPHVKIRFRDAFWPVVAGFAAGLVVPARAGDVLRAWMLARRTHLPTATVVAAAALDYLIGAATLVPVLALVAIGTPLPGWARTTLGVFAIIAVAGTVAVWFLRPPRDRPVPTRGAKTGLVARLRGGLAAAHEPRAIAASVLWGLCGWGAEALIALFALAALGLPTTFPVAALLVVATTAANIVVVSPGNAGPFELAAMVALAGVGVDRAPALALALLYHLVHLVPVAVLGLWVLVRDPTRGPPPEESGAPGP
jgi:glycosyltransferase AglD